MWNPNDDFINIYSFLNVYLSIRSSSPIRTFCLCVSMSVYWSMCRNGCYRCKGLSPCRYIRNYVYNHTIYVYNHTILGNQWNTREGLPHAGQPFLLPFLLFRQRLIYLHQLGHTFALGHVLDGESASNYHNRAPKTRVLFYQDISLQIIRIAVYWPPKRNG